MVTILQRTKPILYLIELSCAAEAPLLDGVNPVPDSYFTASSEVPGMEAIMARMSDTSWWYPEFDTEPLYLQVGHGSMVKTESKSYQLAFLI